jgi:molecular chaperone GrpE (heat shock protein)
MSHKRQVWETFSELAQRLLAAAETPPPPTGSSEDSGFNLDQVSGEIKRLGKAQFKANALQEAALDQLRQAVEQLTARDQEAQRQTQASALHDLLTALVPILDGVEAALNSGERLLTQPASNPADERWVARHLAGNNEQEEAARMILPSDRALLSAWLDGVRLVRERILALLADAGVEPIPTVGHPFDPHLHQAVGTIIDGAHPGGVVVAEQRRGYTGPAGVLRYAEVIVNRITGEHNP